MINPKSHDADAELERRIDFQAGLLTSATSRDEQLAAQEELKRLHEQRSAQRIAQMEHERGLR